MRSSRSSNDIADVARRRLELLSAELAEIRPAPVAPPSSGVRDGSGEPPSSLPTDDPPDAHGASAPGPGRHAHRPVGRGVAAAGWVQDRMPPALQGRLRLTSAHLMVLLLVAVVGAAATGWWVLRANGPATPVPLSAAGPAIPLPVGPSGVSATPVRPSASALGSGGSTGVPGSAISPGAGVSPTSGSGRIVVDVTGRVRRPGIATLPLGARVFDAIRAAGGARRGTALGSLNLARVLADGEQVLVGVRPPRGIAASAAAAGTASGTASAPPLVNLNTATQAELEELPGVGPVTAQSILAFRTEKGTFTSVDELLEVSGIGDATLAKIAPYVTL